MVPSQGFLNALVYGWTRGDFLSVMARQRHKRTHPDTPVSSYETIQEEAEDTDVEDEEEDWERAVRNSLLLSTSRAKTQ